MSLPSKTCLFFITLQLITIICCQEVIKRAPSGFVGMRGKKYLGRSEHFYKRKPQFFVGVKGKKSINDYLSTELYKRAPMGFVGMRGKKDDLQDYYESYKRAPMGFIGMRGKKDPDLSDYLYSSEYAPKRASLIGQIDYSANEDVSREPGSYPLLNRLLLEYLQQLKDNENSIEASNFKFMPRNDSQVDTSDPDDTRSSAESVSNEVDKRAAHMHQFYGVRGKKSVQTKRPFDLSFRGKFIGVRGKKDLKSSGFNELKFLLDHEEPWSKRKGQMSGFFGMRGKKWTDESSLESEYPN